VDFFYGCSFAFQPAFGCKLRFLPACVEKALSGKSKSIFAFAVIELQIIYKIAFGNDAIIFVGGPAAHISVKH